MPIHRIKGLVKRWLWPGDHVSSGEGRYSEELAPDSQATLWHNGYLRYCNTVRGIATADGLVTAFKFPVARGSNLYIVRPFLRRLTMIFNRILRAYQKLMLEKYLSSGSEYLDPLHYGNYIHRYYSHMSAYSPSHNNFSNHAFTRSKQSTSLRPLTSGTWTIISSHCTTTSVIPSWVNKRAARHPSGRAARSQCTCASPTRS